MNTHTIEGVECVSAEMHLAADLIEELHNVSSFCWLCPGKRPAKDYCEKCPDGYVYVPIKFAPILAMRGATFK